MSNNMTDQQHLEQLFRRFKTLWDQSHWREYEMFATSDRIEGYEIAS